MTAIRIEEYLGTIPRSCHGRRNRMTIITQAIRWRSFLRKWIQGLILLIRLSNLLGATEVFRQLADVPEPIDIVDVFRDPMYLNEIVDAAIAVGAKILWPNWMLFRAIRSQNEGP